MAGSISPGDASSRQQQLRALLYDNACLRCDKARLDDAGVHEHRHFPPPERALLRAYTTRADELRAAKELNDAATSSLMRRGAPALLCASKQQPAPPTHACRMLEMALGKPLRLHGAGEGGGGSGTQQVWSSATPLEQSSASSSPHASSAAPSPKGVSASTALDATLPMRGGHPVRASAAAAAAAAPEHSIGARASIGGGSTQTSCSLVLSDLPVGAFKEPVLCPA